MRVKRSKNVKYLSYKNSAGKNGTFHIYIMLKGGNKQGRFVTLALSYQYRHKYSVTHFHFEQLSIIPMVSSLLTFNKYTASGVWSFSKLHFYVSKYNQWDLTHVYVRIF